MWFDAILQRQVEVLRSPGQVSVMAKTRLITAEQSELTLVYAEKTRELEKLKLVLDLRCSDAAKLSEIDGITPFPPSFLEPYPRSALLRLIFHSRPKLTQTINRARATGMSTEAALAIREDEFPMAFSLNAYHFIDFSVLTVKTP